MSDTPRVSIVILNYNHPEIIDVCLRSLAITAGVPYEVVLVDNGSQRDTVKALRQHQAEGRITTLVEEKVNHYFSAGNNLGVRHSHPGSEYILLLNSDVGILSPDWLVKQLAWMEGTCVAKPSIWGLAPTVVKPGPLDIVSIGWSHDLTVLPSHARPEGWCCLIRRKVWRDISPDFPFHHGFEEMVANVCRGGARIGVLSQYSTYLVHAEGRSGGAHVANQRTPDIAGWFRGLDIECLDFCLGPNEHLSYTVW